MTYGAFLILHPLFWASLTGAAVGAALATATRRAKRDRRPARARSRKWTGTTLWATLGVASATCGFLIPPGVSFLGLPSLYAGAGWLCIAAVALRFPRAGGIPVFFLLATAAALGPFLMQPFIPLRDEVVAATVRLLAVDELGALVEISDRAPGASPVPRVISTHGQTVVAHLHHLRISEYLFILGARGGIAFATLGNEGVLEDDPTQAPEPSVDPRNISLYTGMEFIERLIEFVPWLDLTLAETDPVRLSLLKSYEIVGIAGAGIHLRSDVGSD